MAISKNGAIVAQQDFLEHSRDNIFINSRLVTVRTKDLVKRIRLCQRLRHRGLEDEFATLVARDSDDARRVFLDFLGISRPDSC